jgi:hypothetical protein
MPWTHKLRAWDTPNACDIRLVGPSRTEGGPRRAKSADYLRFIAGSSADGHHSRDTTDVVEKASRHALKAFCESLPQARLVLISAVPRYESTIDVL